MGGHDGAKPDAPKASGFVFCNLIFGFVNPFLDAPKKATARRLAGDQPSALCGWLFCTFWLALVISLSKQRLTSVGSVSRSTRCHSLLLRGTEAKPLQIDGTQCAQGTLEGQIGGSYGSR